MNAPDRVVEDYIGGLVAASPHLARVHDWPVVVRAESARKASDRVAVVSGGGSGHEPAHAGYVGKGMLDAAVLGPVFTSPSVDSILTAIRVVATDAGVLLIVKNYTGDRLNFALAADLARAEGIESEMVVVADDAALGDQSRAGRRGLTATVLAHKVAGAAAERGWSIDRIAECVRALLGGTATMGVALGGATVPGSGATSFELGDGEVEWGLGIHGEVGRERGPLPDSRGIARRLVEQVVADRAYPPGTDVVLVVNSLGGTPDLELRILQGDVLAELEARGLRVLMAWAGPFMTSLEMPGASITVAGVTAEHLELLADEAIVGAFPRTTVRLGPAGLVHAPEAVDKETSSDDALDTRVDERFLRGLDAGVTALIAAEVSLTELDRLVGDGDLGTNLARGANAIQKAKTRIASCQGVAASLVYVADVIRREVGGTSGPLYSVFLLAAADALASNQGELTADDWSRAFSAGVERVRVVGGAQPGDSTMIDALEPAQEALRVSPGTASERIAAAAQAARAGAESTRQWRPKLGRSSYVGDRALGVPDPGAVAIAVLLESIAAGFSSA